MNDRPLRADSAGQTSGEMRIEGICGEFQKAWEAGAQLTIESVLERAPDVRREELLLQLIVLEMALRRLRGDRVDAGAYFERFAEDRKTVAAALALATKHGTELCEATSSHAADGANRIASAASRANDDSVWPEQIGRYQIRRRLGRGSFGSVYLAWDSSLDRLVALKVPGADRIGSRTDIENYLQEARNAAQLDHPGIVRVFDVQQDSDSIYIIQQYIKGRDLAEFLKLESPDPPRIARLLLEISQAIGFAHQHGFVHRDLKPANILLDDQGRVHVADFGMAVHESLQSQRKGEFAGSPAFMSPEQVRGLAHRLDGRSDIWSLGVIMYIMLTGRRPFKGAGAELYDEILHRDPWPPRQFDQAIPLELERICLKCLAKRVVDRYATTFDLEADLEHWLQTVASNTLSKTGTAAEDELRVVPKGLRSFTREDADFYLSLLPGVRDRDQLPQSIRFWKTRIEETDPDSTFPVGVLYGPSGCGKSSLIKAGLQPRLAPQVVLVYVEASGDDTEIRLLKSLRKRFPSLAADCDLPEAFAWLRDNDDVRRGKKTLVVLDQFEQWLHAHVNEQENQLMEGLRHCDGGRLQCMVLVRDDFWMSITRFMHQLEDRLVEAENSGAVDLFDPPHARQVLAAFGRAYDALPKGPLSEDQQQFLDRAIDGLSQGGRIICVRIALFADMMKGRPWSTAELQVVGGAQGVGFAFLQQSFSASTAPPAHRLHRKAAQAVLRILLPEVGSDIKGHMRGYDELLAASGYRQQPDKFAELLRILDKDTRLITPTDPDGTSIREEAANDADQARHYYQLTHDYLVPQLRDWLTSSLKETRQGRVELRLAERAALWSVKPENRHLPSWWEYLNIRLLTKQKNWTEPQRRMIERAGRVHGFRWGTTLAAILLLGLTIQQTVSITRRHNVAARSRTAVDALRNSRGSVVNDAIENLNTLPREAVLRELNARFSDGNRLDKLPIAYALAHFGEVNTAYLVSRIQDAPAAEVDNLVAALKRAGYPALQAMEAAADAAKAEADWRTRARIAILSMYLGAPKMAREMCQLRNDPSQRTIFIDEFSTWYAKLAQPARLADKIEDPDFRSAICLAVGSEDPGEIDANSLQAWKAILLDWYENQPDAGTHSAAFWALKKWEPQRGLPALAPSKLPTEGRHWLVTPSGLTMLKIAAGDFVRRTPGGDKQQTARITRPFLLSDREISVRLFQQFLEDPNYPIQQKPSGWKGIHEPYSPTSDHPLQNLSWTEAAQFCNWLSNREGFRPCYQFQQGSWRLAPEADGYRLPTEAEWEYACRAGATTRFACGDDDSLLERYAVFLANKTEVRGSKFPNPWGLFDMHGNVWEWCHDWDGDFDAAELVQDPLGAVEGMKRVMRGGPFRENSSFVQASIRFPYEPDGRTNSGGVRVARPLASGKAGNATEP